MKRPEGAVSLMMTPKEVETMSEDRGERRPRPRGRKPRRKVCSFCVDKIEYIDYKDVNRASPLRERARQDHAPAA